ncbi:hypothetical protein Tco_0451295 [Tanacetum coccineum]
MVKREVEIETMGECVDEIDKLAELIGKHEADQHCLHSRSCFVNDDPCIALNSSPKELLPHDVGLTRAYNLRTGVIQHISKLVTPSSGFEGQTTWPFFTDARIILPIGRIHSYKVPFAFPCIIQEVFQASDLLSPPKEVTYQQESSLVVSKEII